jgi:hypothetical protein
MKVQTHRGGKDFSAPTEAKCKCLGKDNYSIVYIDGWRSRRGMKWTQIEEPC